MGKRNKGEPQNFHEDQYRLYKEMDVVRLLNDIKSLKVSLKEINHREKVNQEYMVKISFAFNHCFY